MTADTRELYEDAYRIARTSVYGLIIDISVPDAIKNAYVSVGMREQLTFTGWTNERLHKRHTYRVFNRNLKAMRDRYYARKAARNDR